jgi:hypothetical protein
MGRAFAPCGKTGFVSGPESAVARNFRVFLPRHRMPGAPSWRAVPFRAAGWDSTTLSIITNSEVARLQSGRSGPKEAAGPASGAFPSIRTNQKPNLSS